MPAAVFTPELAREIKRFVQREMRLTQSRPAPQKMRRHPGGGEDNTLTPGVTVSGVTAPAADDEMGTVQVQLWTPDPDPDNEGKYIDSGDPIGVKVHADFEDVATGVRVQVEQDVYGDWQLVTYDGCGEDTTPAATATDNTAATASGPGVVELATQTEVNTGTDTARAVTPATLAAYVSSQTTTHLTEWYDTIWAEESANLSTSSSGYQWSFGNGASAYALGRGIRLWWPSGYEAHVMGLALQTSGTTTARLEFQFAGTEPGSSYGCTVSGSFGGYEEFSTPWQLPEVDKGSTFSFKTASVTSGGTGPCWATAFIRYRKTT